MCLTQVYLKSHTPAIFTYTKYLSKETKNWMYFIVIAICLNQVLFKSH